MPKLHPTAAVSFQESDPLPYTLPTAHHHISNSNYYYNNLTAWLGTYPGDPALIIYPLFNCLLSAPETM